MPARGQPRGSSSPRASRPCTRGPLYDRRVTPPAPVIADVAGIDDVVDLPGLVNLHYGEWEALTSREAAAHNPIEFARYQSYATGAICPGGEALDVAPRSG